MQDSFSLFDWPKNVPILLQDCTPKRESLLKQSCIRGNKKYSTDTKRKAALSGQRVTQLSYSRSRLQKIQPTLYHQGRIGRRWRCRQRGSNYEPPGSQERLALRREKSREGSIRKTQKVGEKEMVMEIEWQ